jgi:hypothetical protein
MAISDTHFNPNKRCAIADFVDSLPDNEKPNYDYFGPCGIIQRESRRARRARKAQGESWNKTDGAQNKSGEIIITRSGNSQIHSCVNHVAIIRNEGVEIERAVQNHRPTLNPGESPDVQKRFDARTALQNERADKALARQTKRTILDEKRRKELKGQQKGQSLPERRTRGEALFPETVFRPPTFNSQDPTTTAPNPTPNKRTRRVVPTDTGTPVVPTSTSAPTSRIKRFLDEDDEGMF